MFKAIVLVVLSIIYAFSQSDDVLFEELLSEDFQLEDIDKKKNLEKITLQDLYHLSISKSLAKQIILERSLGGGYDHINELLGVKGMTDTAFSILKANTYCKEQIWKYFKHQKLKVDYYQAIVFQNRNPWSYLNIQTKQRIRLQKGPIKLGLHYEKDALERLNPQLNHWGGFLSINLSKKYHSKIIFGDYRFHFAQGLNWMTQSSFNQSVFAPYAFSLYQRDKGFNSFDENYYQRGVYYQSTIGKKWSYSIFTSSRKRNYRWDGKNISLQLDGVKDANYELKQPYTNRDFLLGGKWNYAIKNIEWSGIYLFKKDAIVIDTNINLPGSHQFGGYFSWYLGAVKYYLESSYKDNKLSFKTGLELKLSKYRSFYVDLGRIAGDQVDGSILSLFSYRKNGELKTYFGAEDKIGKRTYVTATFLNRSELNTAQANRFLRWAFLWRYKWTRNNQLFFKIQQDRSFFYEEEDGLKINNLIRSTIFRLRVHYELKLTEKCTFKTRVEWVKRKEKKVLEQGYLFFLDFILKPLPSLKIKSRIQWFDIPSYSSRIYAYQQNIRYLYEMKAFYFEGLQFILNLEYKWRKHWHIGLRGSWVNYEAFDYVKSQSNSITQPLMYQLSSTVNYVF